MASDEQNEERSIQDHLALIQGSLSLCAVAALFCAQPETLEVFKAYVKKMNIYPDTEWIKPGVLCHASVQAIKHSRFKLDLKGMKNVGDLLDELLRG